MRIEGMSKLETKDMHKCTQMKFRNLSNRLSVIYEAARVRSVGVLELSEEATSYSTAQARSTERKFLLPYLSRHT